MLLLSKVDSMIVAKVEDRRKCKAAMVVSRPPDVLVVFRNLAVQSLLVCRRVCNCESVQTPLMVRLIAFRYLNLLPKN